jgi:RNA polymerase sigma factor (sigma-70 family)
MMTEHDWLAESFEQHRTHLRAVALRILGSQGEADDAVQEAWLRLSRSDTRDVANLGGWLTTVVARVCLDLLRSRRSHAEVHIEDETERLDEQSLDPEQEVLLASSLGPALMVVLDALAPAERVAFVLHDLFGVSFEEIGPILGRSPVAARQLASRARRRVQGAGTESDVDSHRQREIVTAFLAASRKGDFGALIAMLDPDVIFRADEQAVEMGAARIGLSSETRGADAVASFFKGRAQGARLAVVDGVSAAVWAPGGRPRAVFHFKIVGETILAINLVADAEALGRMSVAIAGREGPAPP